MKTIIKTLLFSSFIGLSACASIENTLFDFAIGVERSFAGFEEKSIELEEHKWVYLEANANQGKQTVLLLHGFATEKDNWTRMAKSLDDYHVVAPDLPGHGESSFNKNLFYGFDVQSLRLARFVDDLGLEDFHIVGNSMGGGIAALYAYRNKHKVKTITLIDAVGFYGSEPSDLETILANGGDNPLIVESLDDFDRLIEYAMHKPPFMPWPAKPVLTRKAIERQAANEHIFEHIHKEAEAARYAGGFKHVFEQLTMPGLVVWGDQDRVLDVSSVEQFYLNMPNVEVNVFPQIGHAPMLEVPSLTAKVLIDFWQRKQEQDDQTANMTIQ
ncbi:alpha/beta fold hydrolase [Bermanella sp. R86510]|uniref:alpha/beta fold hydrolase n=1 Tax=unclassified Bermanella TaxID=2627862 RepID=UPI0037C84CA1